MPLRKALCASLSKWTPKYHLSYGRVLDLACGSGESTLAIEWWFKRVGLTGTVEAADPYTYQAFEDRVGRPAERFSFADVEVGHNNKERPQFDFCGNKWSTPHLTPVLLVCPAQVHV